ncbi:hypothetical protein V8C42DRAFT_308309 [Trichoderma barbatum]
MALASRLGRILPQPRLTNSCTRTLTRHSASRMIGRRGGLNQIRNGGSCRRKKRAENAGVNHKQSARGKGKTERRSFSFVFLAWGAAYNVFSLLIDCRWSVVLHLFRILIATCSLIHDWAFVLGYIIV